MLLTAPKRNASVGPAVSWRGKPLLLSAIAVSALLLAAPALAQTKTQAGGTIRLAPQERPFNPDLLKATTPCPSGTQAVTENGKTRCGSPVGGATIPGPADTVVNITHSNIRGHKADDGTPQSGPADAPLPNFEATHSYATKRKLPTVDNK